MLALSLKSGLFKFSNLTSRGASFVHISQPMITDVYVVDYFACINGKRVPAGKLCDNVNDCGDNSDEQNCGMNLCFFPFF